MEKRIYGTKINIDTEKTKELYNKRAQNIADMGNIYTSVLLGDQNPDYAELWNASEKEIIDPYLKINSQSAVLDLGCGIGRWAETILPICKSYIGVDFSSEMISFASDRLNTYLDDNKKFICSSVQDFLNTSPDGFNPNVIIFSYVCMYINDSELQKCFRRLSEIAGNDCVIYFIDTVALEKRLTLNEIFSSALKSDYSALYRTIDEYEELFSIFKKNGFKIIKSGFMDKHNNEPQYSETDRHYTLLERM